jgi:hypothetical protein
MWLIIWEKCAGQHEFAEVYFAPNFKLNIFLTIAVTRNYIRIVLKNVLNYYVHYNSVINTGCEARITDLLNYMSWPPRYTHGCTAAFFTKVLIGAIPLCYTVS